MIALDSYTLAIVASCNTAANAYSWSGGVSWEISKVTDTTFDSYTWNWVSSEWQIASFFSSLFKNIIDSVNFAPNFLYFAPFALFCDYISKKKLNITGLFPEGFFGDVWKVLTFDFRKLTSDLGRSVGLNNWLQRISIRNDEYSEFLISAKVFKLCTVNAFIDP